MMAKAIDEQLVLYLPMLGVDEKESLLGVIKSFLHLHQEEKNVDAPWDDPNFVAEKDRRYASYKDGSAKTYSWEEVRQAAHK
jgi:hypothetical protein